MTTAEYYRAANAKPVSGRQVKLEFHVQAPQSRSRDSADKVQETMPTIMVRYGQTGKIEIMNESIYPTDYIPTATVETPGIVPVTPANPTVFVTSPVGWPIEATAEKEGAFIRVKGEARYVAQTGMSSVPAGAGPLTTEDRIVLTDNVTQFPRFAEYSTPFTLLVFPGKAYDFEVSHPQAGTKLEVTATALP